MNTLSDKSLVQLNSELAYVRDPTSRVTFQEIGDLSRQVSEALQRNALPIGRLQEKYPEIASFVNSGQGI